MKKLSFLVMTFALIFLLGSPALAQQFDLSAGVSGLTAPSGTDTLQTIGGGAYPNFGLDFLFFHNLGVGFNAAFRAKQNIYQGQLPFRPFFYDVDAVYAPPWANAPNWSFRRESELRASVFTRQIFNAPLPGVRIS